MKVEIRKIRRVKGRELSQIINLYGEAGWLDQYDNEKRIKEMINGTYLFVAAYYNRKIVAMARVISDKVNDAYIQDLFVSKKFRNRNIGSSILSYITEYLIKRGFRWISLIAEKGTYDFYKKNGFKYIKEMKFFKYEFGKIKKFTH